MFSTVKPFFLHAVSSVHVGSGSEVGLVDLPIQREKITGYPKIEGSSLKGALRSAVENKNPDKEDQCEQVFGSKPKNDSQASAISLSDARIFLFPVRSMRGIFAWVTCPFVLNRFNREMALFLNTEKVSFSPLPLPEANTVAEGSKVVVKDDKLVLEEYTIPVRAAKKTDALAVELEKLLDGLCGIGLTERLIVLDNDNFKNFVQYSTEVNARIRLSDDGTVEDGALWYEENVPPEAIFYSTLFVGNVRFIPKKGEQVVNVNDFITTYFPKVLQIGGDYTLGRGIVQTKFLRKGAAINA